MDSVFTKIRIHNLVYENAVYKQPQLASFPDSSRAHFYHASPVPRPRPEKSEEGLVTCTVSADSAVFILYLVSRASPPLHVRGWRARLVRTTVSITGVRKTWQAVYRRTARQGGRGSRSQTCSGSYG